MRPRFVLLLVLVVLAVCDPPPTDPLPHDLHLLTYGRPHAALPTGFGLYSTARATLSSLSTTDGRIETSPSIHGVLLGSSYAVLYGSFNYLGPVLASNILVLTVADGTWTPLQPSVWGSSVRAAVWQEVDKSFFVAGNFGGLDSAIDKATTSVALCYIGDGCYSIDEGLPSLPFTIQLVWTGSRLVVLWMPLAPYGVSTHSKAWTMADWTPADGWNIDSLPNLRGVSITLGTVGPHVALNFDTQTLASQPVFCSQIDPSLATGVLFNPFSQHANCWFPGPFVAFASSAVATTSKALYRFGFLNNNNNTVSLIRIEPVPNAAPMDVTYNLAPGLLPHLASSSNCVVVGYSFSHAWVLREGARSWVPLTSVTCPGDASTLSPLQFMSVNDDCTTVAFVCPALCFNSGMCNDRGSVVVVDVLLDTVINVLPWQHLSSAATVSQMCLCGSALIVAGDFAQVRLQDREYPIQGAAVWDLSTATWTPIPGLPDQGTGQLVCTVEKGVVWVAHARTMDTILVFGRYDADAHVWDTWTLEQDVGLFIDAAAQGPAVDKTHLYLGAVASDVQSIFQFLLLRWPKPAPSARSATPVPNATVVAMFQPLGNAGQVLGVVVFGRHVYLFGSFGANIGGILHSDVVRYNMHTAQWDPMPGLRYDPTLPYGVPSTRIQAMAIGDPRGGATPHALLWAAGWFGTRYGLDDVSNLAGLNTSGAWVASTASLNGPPSFAPVWDMTFDASGRELLITASDSLYSSGLVRIDRGLLFPPSDAAPWVSNMNVVVNIETTATNASWLLVVYPVATVLVICLVTAVVVALWRAGASQAFRYIEIPDYASHGLQTNVDAMLRDVDIAKLSEHDVELVELIGQGGQASVMRAVYRDTFVAAKALLSVDNFAAFAKEVKLIASVRHPNIVSFVGIVFKEERLWMVTELMDADLSAVADQLDPASKLGVSRDVARAMDYLHSFHPPVLHRDLKPSNVLLTRSGTVKLADFGVSRLQSRNTNNPAPTQTKDAGTLLYMAPELWESGAVYGTACDVYSFGLLLVELWSGRSPFYPHEFTWMLDFMERVRAREVVPGVANMPLITPDVVRSTAARCADWDPTVRPAFKFIAKAFGETRLLDELVAVSSSTSSSSLLRSGSGPASRRLGSLRASPREPRHPSPRSGPLRDDVTLPADFPGSSASGDSSGSSGSLVLSNE